MKTSSPNSWIVCGIGLLCVAAIIGWLQVADLSPRNQASVAPTSRSESTPIHPERVASSAPRRIEAAEPTSVHDVAKPRIAGYVCTTAALPVPGATVTCVTVPAVFSGTIEFASQRAIERVRNEHITRTDDAGRFSLAEFPSGRVLLAVRADGFSPLDKFFWLDSPPANTDLGKLTLSAGAALDGRVVDSRGNGIVGARLSRLREAGAAFVLDEANNPNAVSIATTGENGAFTTAWFLPGSWRFQVASYSNPLFETRVADIAPGLRSGVMFELEDALEISGTVQGAPEHQLALLLVCGQQLRTRTSATDVDERAPGVGPVKAPCSADGKFTLKKLPAKSRDQTYALCVRDQHGWEIPLEAPVLARPGDHDLLLNLKPPSWIAFGVRDKKDGAPLENPQVFVECWVGRSRRSHNDWTQWLLQERPGRFRMKVPTPTNEATLGVVISTDGSETYFENGLSVTPGEVIDLGWISLERRPICRVRVIDAETKQPVSDAAVIAVEQNALGDKLGSLSDRARRGEKKFQLFRQRIEERTDGDGYARMPLDQGARTFVLATHPHYATDSPLLFPNGTDELTIELQTGVAAEVVVTKDGHRVSEAWVRHEFESNNHRLEVLGLGYSLSERDLTDQSGAYVFTHLPRGVHRFRIEDPVGPWTEIRIEGPPMPTVSLTLP